MYPGNQEVQTAQVSTQMCWQRRSVKCAGLGALDHYVLLYLQILPSFPPVPVPSATSPPTWPDPSLSVHFSFVPVSTRTWSKPWLLAQRVPVSVMQTVCLSPCFPSLDELKTILSWTILIAKLTSSTRYANQLRILFKYPFKYFKYLELITRTLIYSTVHVESCSPGMASDLN